MISTTGLALGFDFLSTALTATTSAPSVTSSAAASTVATLASTAVGETGGKDSSDLLHNQHGGSGGALSFVPNANASSTTSLLSAYNHTLKNQTDMLTAQVASTLSPLMNSSSAATTTSTATAASARALPTANDTGLLQQLLSRVVSSTSSPAATNSNSSLLLTTTESNVLHFVTPQHDNAVKHNTPPPFSREGDLTGWLTRGGSDFQAWHPNHNIYMLYATFALIVLAMLSLVFWIKCRRRWSLLRYDRLPTTVEIDDDPAIGATASDPSFVYKPKQDSVLDEEYENTFVGVSIPILQDVTKV